MFRLPPSRIIIEDINPTNLRNQFDPTAAISASLAVNAPDPTPVMTRQGPCAEHQTPASIAPAPTLVPPIEPDPINAYMGSAWDFDLPPPTQLPYDHLPYGPEREAIVHQNHHISHLEHMNSQLNAQSAIVHSIIAQMGASHQQTLDRLTAEIRFNHLQNKIHHWRERVMIEQEADRHNEDRGGRSNQAADLVENFTDLGARPISGLAGVRAAEPASGVGVETELELELDLPIATVPGIEDVRGGAFGDGDDDANATVPGSGRLYGAAEDLAVFLAGEGAGESDVAEWDASSATPITRPGVTPALRGAGPTTNGLPPNIHRALTTFDPDVDVDVDVDVGQDRPTHLTWMQDHVVRPDAHCAPAALPPHRHRRPRRRRRRRHLLGRLIRAIFK